MTPAVRAVLAVLLFALLPCCAHSPSSERSGIEPADPRLYAVPGEPALIPIKPLEPLPEHVEVTLADGRVLEATARRVSVMPDDSPRAWLPPAGKWSSSEAAQPPPVDSLTTCYIVVETPTDAVGADVLIAGKHLPVTWLRSQDPGAAPAPPAPPAALQRILEPEKQSPVRRWRYKLVTRTLSDPDSSADSFPDPTLEALARQTEARWRHALARIGRQAPRVAARLVARLGKLASVGGRLVPAWPVSLADLDSLLAGISDPLRTEPQAAAVAESFLDSQREGIAWIADDAGGQTADRNMISIVDCLNLSERPALTSCTWTGVSNGEPELSSLAPAAFQSFRVTRPKAARSLPGDIEARIGSWSARLAALPAPIAAKPPGVIVGPFERDWTLDGIYTGRASPSATAAVLRIYNDAQSDGWTVYIECLRGPNAPTDSSPREEYLRLWLGPAGSPRAIIRISEGSEVVVESLRLGLASAPEAIVVSEPARWAVKVRIPSSCIETDGVLLLGAERYDSSGERSAAPRAMLPWQQEPGRVAIDTRAW